MNCPYCRRPMAELPDVVGSIRRDGSRDGATSWLCENSVPVQGAAKLFVEDVRSSVRFPLYSRLRPGPGLVVEPGPDVPAVRLGPGAATRCGSTARG